MESFEDHGIHVHRTHGQVKVECPKCQHERRVHRHDKPLSVNIDEGAWLCHHCGFTGGLAGKAWSGPRPDHAYQKPDLADDRRLHPNARAFLEARGIDPDVAERALVYSKPDGSAIAFPYTRHGEIIHVKYRTIEDKRFYSTKDTERTVYGYDQCDGSETVLVVEGELDRLACLTAGFMPTCSVPDGAPNEHDKPDAKLGWLEGCEHLFESARKVIIGADMDPNGQRLADELARRIGPEKCYRVQWPIGCKDANDTLMQHGAASLVSCIDGAKAEPIVGIHDGDDLYDDIMQAYERGRDPGMDFGHPALDTIYTVLPGYMTVVTGHAGHGKSTSLDYLLIQLAKRHGGHITMFSPEQQPYTWHQAQLMEQYTGTPFWDGPTPRMSRIEVEQANAWVTQHFSFISPESPSVESILVLAKLQVYRRGATGLVIDPWNELEHAMPRGMNESTYVAEVLGKLRQFARNHKVHLWLVAHPTKMQRNDDKSEQVPGLQDISGSNNFRNKADFGITVWRDLKDAANPVDILVTKTRRVDAAKLGRVRFDYNPISKRLENGRAYDL